MSTPNNMKQSMPRKPTTGLRALLFILVGLLSGEVFAATPVIYQEETPDLSIKVLGGYINVVRAFVDGHWVVNQNWQPLKMAYDAFDGSVMRLGRGRHDYSRAAGGVFFDSLHYCIRQSTTGFTWSDRAGNSITYDGNGIPLSYADRNGVGGTFIVATAASGAKQLTGVKDHLGNQVLWVEYNGDDLARAYDYTHREVRYTYNAHHELTDVTDANGQVWKYGYTNGVPTSVTDPEKRTTTRTWISNGEIGSIRFGDNTGADYVQDYDSSKSLYFTRETTTGGRVTETWSTLGQKLIRKDIGGVTFIKGTPATSATRTRTTTDARGLTVTETLDEWDNVLKTTYQDGTSVSTTYDPVYSNPLTYTNELGVVTKLEYDAKGNVLRVTEAVGLPEQRITEMSYDQYGQRKTVKRLADANTAEAWIQFDYDTHGNVIQITDAENHVTQFPSAEYDVTGNPKKKIDARGKLWTRTYDNRGLLLTSTDPLNHINKYGYDKTGSLTSTTDAVNNLTQYTYNARGKVTVITDPYGGITRYDYNDANLITKVTDPDGHVQSAKYYPDGRAYQQIDGNNNTTEFVYGDMASGLNGLVTKILYPTFSQEYKYDLRSRVTETIDVADATTRLSIKSILNNIGNPTSVTDKENKTTGYKYDNLQRVKTVTDALQGVSEYTYDNRDNLIAIKDANGKIRRFSYDRTNRAVTETRPLGQLISYAYDETGHLVQLTDAKGQVQTFHYDDAGRQDTATYYANATDAAGNTHALQTVTYTYNNLDALTGYSDGASTGTYTYDLKQLRNIGVSVNYGTFALAYQYDYYANGSKKSYTGPDGVTVTYTYDANDQLATLQLPGIGDLTVNAYQWYKPSQITYPGGSITKQIYDPLMRLTDITVTNPAQVAVLNHHYTHDNADNLKTKTTERGNYSYTYDDLYRLTSATNPTPLPNETYTYDAVDNRLTDSKTAGLWSYNDNQQLTGVEAYTYAYDASGNTTKRLNTTLPSLNRRYVYDHLDQLTEVHDQNDALIATYTYDPFGHRLSKTVGSVTTYFVYSDEGLIAEATGSGSVTKTYGYQPDGIWGTDPVYLREGGKTYYYLSDRQGTPQQLIAQDGRVVWSALADSFGNTSVDGSSTLTNNLRFAGQYYDAETGLHYNGSRYYDPLTGRYLSEDPLGVNGGMNLYAYVNGNPVNGIDPYGLFSISDPSTWPVFPQPVVDFAACFGDTLSLGITHWIRSKNDTNTYVDFCSDPCSYGKYSGFALDLLMGEAVVVKAIKWVRVPRVNTKRVGRWMHPDELAKMRKTGHVQEGGKGQTRFADPANPNTYKNPPNGDVYVEFDVPANRILPHSKGTGRIEGPNSPAARIPGRNPTDYEMPPATNIRVH